MSEKVYGICGTNKCRKEVIPRNNIQIFTATTQIIAHSDTVESTVTIPLFTDADMGGQYIRNVSNLAHFVSVISVCAYSAAPNSFSIVIWDMQHCLSDLFEVLSVTPVIIEQDDSQLTETIGIKVYYKAKPKNSAVTLAIKTMLDFDNTSV